MGEFKKNILIKDFFLNKNFKGIFLKKQVNGKWCEKIQEKIQQNQIKICWHYKCQYVQQH